MAERLGRGGQQVLSVLAADRVHLRAEDIAARLPDVGKATVYRNLESLEQQGLIKKLRFGVNSAYYEYVRSEHLHFICDVCGEVYDMPCDPSGLLGEVSRLCGHEMRQCDAVCRGVCRSCQKEHH